MDLKVGFLLAAGIVDSTNMRFDPCLFTSEGSLHLLDHFFKSMVLWCYGVMVS